MEKEDENRNLIRHLKQVLCALLQRDYVSSILSHIQSCVRAAPRYDDRCLASVAEELQAAALSLSALFSLVQVRTPTTLYPQMTEPQARALQAALPLLRAAAPAFQPLASALHSTLLQPFFFPAHFTQAVTPAFTQGDLLSSEMLGQRLRQLRQLRQPRQPRQPGDANSVDLLFALSLVALRVNTPEAVDALREVPTAAASHA